MNLPNLTNFLEETRQVTFDWHIARVYQWLQYDTNRFLDNVLVYAAVDELQPGDIMLWDMGYESGTIAFMQPGFVAVFRHAMQKDLKIVIVSTAVESPMLVGRAMEEIRPEENGYVYGVDLNLALGPQ